jgi:hypothetical protein
VSNTEQPPGGRARLHEPDQPSIKLLVLFGFGLFASIGIVLFFVGWSFYSYAHRVTRTEAPAPRLARTELPPQPRLQVNPQLDLKHMRAQEDQHLDTYRWVDRPDDRISIPIDRALDYVARHGLPPPSGKGAGQQ